MPENEKCWACVQLVKYYPESVPMSALAEVQGQDIPLCDMHWSWWVARWLHSEDEPGCSAHVVNLPPALPAHNRWAPDCVHHRKPTGETSQYLTDYNREESCPACVPGSSVQEPERWKWTCQECGAAGTMPDDVLSFHPHDCRSRGPFDEVARLLVEPVSGSSDPSSEEGQR